MDFGKLNRLLTIQVATEVEGTIGNSQTLTWADVKSVWASIRPLSSKEIATAGSIDASVSHHIKIRYYSGLTSRHRFVFGSRTFNIVQLLNKDERNIEMNIIAMEDV